MGSALLWSPFYLAAHAGVLAARALGAQLPADGYGLPYLAAVCYASSLYGLLGLLLIHDALRRFGAFAEPVASLSVVALWLGTPALYYMTLAPGFSHAGSLFAVSLLLWLWLRLHKRGSGAVWEWALLGAAGGLAGLVREQDALFLAVPGVYLAWQSLRRRDYASGAVRLLALAGAAGLTFLPQLLVYRALYGRFGPSRIVSSKMEYSSPYFFAVLFDPGHGLFFWTPLLLLCCLGLGLGLAVRRRADAPAVLLSLAVLALAWICGALLTWTQAGAFGSRRFVSATLPFAWGLATLAAALLPRLGRRGLLAGVLLFTWWNVSLMVQFGLRLMDRQRLEWPQVAVNQLVEVPPRLARVAWLFFSDRERLVREGL
jgi:hypothetical protein